MTKESYIKKVKRKLILPKDLKYAIISDLEETFDSAKEQGETSESVIKRLGCPEDFISDVMENLEFSAKEIKLFKRRKNMSVICIFFAVVSLLATLWAVVYSIPMNMNVIGYSNIPTSIGVTGGFGYLIPYILCIAFWLLCVCSAVYYCYLKRK